jgi:disulfide bond formation protein DsbB
VFVLIAPEHPLAKKMSTFVHTHILTIGFLISLAAVVSSLVYSNVIGYPPCMLCWYARIAFYPQALMFAMALIKKDRSILPYTLALTIAGVVISTYHYIAESIQYSPLPCSAGSVSCLTRYVYEYGFITIPLMGLVGFASLLCALLVAKKASKSNTL